MNWYFPHIRCVNLARRPDKWAECEKEFAKHNLTVERFDAIDGSKIEHDPRVLDGSIGNLISQTTIIKEAKEKGYENVLILEDDVEFEENINEIFKERIKGVPDDWDLLYLGGNHNRQKIDLVSPYVRRINDTYATHAYAIKNTVYDLALEYLEEKSREGDVILAEVQKKCNAYCFHPNIAWQRAGISDVFNRYVDYSFLRRKDNSTPIRDV